MNKLIIKTRYHVTVELLLMHFQMIERHHHVEVMNDGIEVDHPDDGLSQDLVFWLSMAEGCGLIESYLFARKFSPRGEKQALDHVEECLDMLHTSIMIGLHPKEAYAGPVGIESQVKVVEQVKDDYKKLRDAIKALRKEKEA